MSVLAAYTRFLLTFITFNVLHLSCFFSLFCMYKQKFGLHFQIPEHVFLLSQGPPGLPGAKGEQVGLWSKYSTDFLYK